ncbi:MAG: ABC transporter ATP-binding protein [Gammaproteobacteria bacterium]
MKISMSELNMEMQQADIEVNPAIRIENLVKKFGNFTAVDDISFSVRQGEIFGFLGANGAGKSTTINILTTTMAKTSGRVEIFDKEISLNEDEVRKMIGIVFQDPSLDEELTARENLEFHARLYKVKENHRDVINKVLRLVNLEDKAEIQVKSFSGGMKRRLEIARGLVHKPRILFLDEPTLGLDVQTRKKLWEYIAQLKVSENMTIMLTTHYMEEAEALCDRVAIIDQGTIIVIDSIKNLKRTYKAKTLEEVFLKVTGTAIREGEAESNALMLKKFGALK